MAKLGIVNLTLLVTALGSSATVVGQVMGDGEVTLGDLRYARAALESVKKFQGVVWKDLLPEAKDLDQVEQEALATLFGQVFVLPPHLKTTEEMVEAGLGYVLLLLDAIGVFIPDTTGTVKVPLRALAKAA